MIKKLKSSLLLILYIRFTSILGVIMISEFDNVGIKNYKIDID